jgi:hypothetical protein
MGPLLSLIRAYSVRDEFLRVNKDIVNTFAILAAGEQLLVGIAFTVAVICAAPAAMSQHAVRYAQRAWQGNTSKKGNVHYMLAGPCGSTLELNLSLH